MENSVWRTLGPKGIMARVEGEGEKGQRDFIRVMASPPKEGSIVRAIQLVLA